MNRALSSLLYAVGVISGGGMLLLALHGLMNLFGYPAPWVTNQAFLDGFLWASLGAIVGRWMQSFVQERINAKQG